MKRVIPILCVFAASLFASLFANAASDPEISGELKKWHKVTLTFEGPETSETASPNPFYDYKFDVVFTHAKSGKSYSVPGYFAADGNAGQTSATSGNKWRVHFAPDETGEWSYEASFYHYRFISVRENTVKLTKQAKTSHMHGATGSFSIAKSDKSGDDFRGKGRLQYTGDRYLRFAETGEIFFKCGPDAPENVFAYEDFDGTFHNDGHADQRVKTWEAHLKDWNEGDPTWGSDNRGKALIGAMNYLHEEGMNAFSFLTMNIMGDDHNVFPYIDYDTHDRFDVSKLDQWEIVFQHASKLGIFLHFKTQEAENQGLLDGGGLGATRRLYYRELIARFGHNLALNWNMGEELGEWQPKPRTPPQYQHQRLAMAEYFYNHDPYRHHVVIHNGNWFDDVYGADSKYTGASLQTNKPDFHRVHGAVLNILEASAKAGKQWAVAVDEPGDASYSLVPDAVDPTHDNARSNALWGAYLAGAWGVEWYFGYKEAHSDLTCEDWRSRDLFWDQCKIAIDFLHGQDLPYAEMKSMDNLIVDNGPTVNSAEGDYCLALPGDSYLLYLRSGDERSLSLEAGKYQLAWFNPREGGDLQSGSVKKINAKSKGEHSLGKPPVADGKDWVAVLRKR
ncbi:DUF5060 domain-containing protein [Pelagicoccus mobilis]|uniref:DUF5060 domain-containing protein n=1 Tax=Pelagicoccus mobilis TaxID=415221 RepID=A0A934VU14_9BACT|nr:DUF5060 domain-containing protein [Pelagicoccus mobilis]MBK1880625.1 DUF5060 domain-containing protein [Pelagicoccus mobilis]